MDIVKIIFFLVLISGKLTGQEEFKGYIKYKNSVETGSTYISSKEVTRIYGNGSVYYYDKGNSFQKHKNGSLDFSYLDCNTKEYFMKNKGNDTLYCYDTKKYDPELLLDLKELTDTKKILQFDCKGIELEIKNLEYGFNYEIVFYYSNHIKIDGSIYTGMKHAFIEDVYTKMNSLPLFFEFHYPAFNLKSEAVKIVYDSKLDLENMFLEASDGLIVKKEN